MSATLASDRWFVRPRPNSLARLRLFCFPVAGGNASAFTGWQEALPDVEICAIQFPGRQQRAAEAPFTRMPLAIQALERAIGPFLDLPFAVFGTCTGSIGGYELAQRLARTHDVHPVHLFVSCCRAPHLPDRDAPIHGLTEDALWMELERLGGTPPIVASHPQMKAILTPLLRADFELAETYHYREAPPLRCPITVFGGTRDTIVSADELTGWERHGSGFALQMLDGGHYLLDSAGDELMARVRGALGGRQDCG